jgi:hypothetical protein
MIARHLAGNRAQKRLAEVRKQQSRSIDRMARYGGAARVKRHVDILVLARHSAPRLFLFSFRTGAVSWKTRNSLFC